MVDRKSAATDFEKKLRELVGDSGMSISLRTTDDDFRIGFYVAGIRVLDATPIFDRNTGEIAHWRYQVMFAEMSILDPLNCGHAVHVQEMVQTSETAWAVNAKATSGEYHIIFVRNDPHDVHDDQALAYDAWDKDVGRAGGQEALVKILDTAAERCIRALGEVGK